jgi:hypothetical protein
MGHWLGIGDLLIGDVKAHWYGCGSSLVWDVVAHSLGDVRGSLVGHWLGGVSAINRGYDGSLVGMWV